MVAILLTAVGFHVEDLADLLAIFALIATKMTEQEKVIESLKKAGI